MHTARLQRYRTLPFGTGSLTQTEPGPVRERISPVGKLLALVVVLCVLDGVVRKWVLQNSSPAVQAIPYFAKDLVFLLAGLIAFKYPTRSREAALPRFAFFLGTGLILIAIPLSLTEVHAVGALLSLRAMIVLPWLALLTAPGLRSMKDVRLLIMVAGGCAVFNAVLGGLQFYLPPTHFLNRRVETHIRAMTALGRVRVSGTFAFPSGIGDMAMMGSWAGCYLALTRPRSLFGYVFILAGLTCGAAAMSRTGLFFSLAIITFTLFSTRRGLVPGIVVVLLLAGLAYVSVADSESGSQEVGLVEGAFLRHRVSDSIAARASHTTGGVPAVLEEQPLGHGIGSGQSGGAAAEADGSRRYSAETEQELPRIAWEVGVVGLVGILICRLALLAVLGMAWLRNRGRSPALYHLRRVSLLTVLMFFCYNTVFDHVANTFAWVIALVALASFEIEAREQAVARYG
jgi:hypothetical protein